MKELLQPALDAALQRIHEGNPTASTAAATRNAKRRITDQAENGPGTSKKARTIATRSSLRTAPSPPPPPIAVR